MAPLEMFTSQILDCVHDRGLRTGFIDLGAPQDLAVLLAIFLLVGGVMHVDRMPISRERT
jgi:hypothetical protein